MGQYIINFRGLSREDVSLVGGKGANLGEMVRAGFPVPAGFSITVQAYRQVVTAIQELIGVILARVNWEDPADVEVKSREIRELILSEPVPREIVDAVTGAYLELGQEHNSPAVAVAVRSSATAEDLPEASFAGQQETFLNVLGSKEVLQRVRECWASLWTTRAMVYRHRQRYDHRQVYLSVVVQLLVESEVAGVAFSVNPINGQEAEILITASYGLGEVVVAGTVNPDTFTLNKKTLAVIDQKLGSKENELVSDPQGQTQLAAVSEARREKYCLDGGWLKEVGALVRRVEAHYGSPQDVEWAMAGGKLYLLQARPVTAFGLSEGLITGKLNRTQKFMLDDFLEHYPEAPHPLDYAVVVMSYQAIIDSFKDLGMKGSQAGEIVTLDRDGKIGLHPPRTRLSLQTLAAPGKLMRAAKSSTLAWEECRQQVAAFLELITTADLRQLANDDLGQVWSEMFKLAAEVCRIRFFYVLVANMVPMVVLTLLLKLFGRGGRNPVLAELVTRGLEYKTAVIDRGLNRLARQAAAEPKLRQIILEEDADLAVLRSRVSGWPAGEDFLRRVEEFLRDHGCRTGKMYQPFSGQSWAENQRRFQLVLRAVLQDPQLQERERLEAEARQEHLAWVDRFRQRLPGPLRGLFQRNYERLRLNHVIREETLYALEELFTAARKIAAETGRRLEESGHLPQAGDIIFLTREEIPRALAGHLAPEENRQLISVRRQHHQNNLVRWKKALAQLADRPTGAEAIKGQPGSPGLTEGPARVILNTGNFGKLQKGDVIICPYTDPTWTPLFGMAAAVVADTGGPLSHAAIVAREYGIPAVLGTKVGTSFFQDGELVVVNGDTGEVYRKTGASGR